MTPEGEDDFFCLVEDLFYEGKFGSTCPSCNELVLLDRYMLLDDLGIDIETDFSSMVNEAFSCPFCGICLIVINTEPLELEAIEEEEKYLLE